MGPYNDIRVPEFLCGFVSAIPFINHKKICDWIYRQFFYTKFLDRKVKIRVDDYDTHSCDYTIALIVAPLLKRFRGLENIASNIDDDDVPDSLKRPTNDSPVDEYGFDINYQARWNWVIDEMIWGMEQIINPDEIEQSQKAYQIQQERISNATRLFGKYFRNLWS